MIHFACYTSVNEQIFTCKWSIFSHNISLSEILHQATTRTCCKPIDQFCPTFTQFPDSFSFPLQWLLSTCILPVALTSLLVGLIRRHMVRHSQSSALGLPEPWCSFLAQYQIHRLPPSHLRWHLDYPSHHDSHANCMCRKCFQVHGPHHIWLYDGQFIQFSAHLTLEFVLWGGL